MCFFQGKQLYLIYGNINVYLKHDILVKVLVIGHFASKRGHLLCSLEIVADSI